MRTHQTAQPAIQRFNVWRRVPILLAAVSMPWPVIAVDDPTWAALDAAVAVVVSDFSDDVKTSNKALHDLATIPEWREPLWDRFTIGYFEGDPLNFGKMDSLGARWTQYLSLLASRADLTEAQVNRVTEEMRRIYTKPYSELKGEDSFIRSGIRMLKHYPSGEHERLCLAGLDWVPEHLVGWMLCEASDSLAEIGSEAALKRLKAAANKVNGSFPGGKAGRSVEFEPNIQALESRLSAERARIKSLNPSVAIGQTTGGSGRGNDPGEEKRGEVGAQQPSFVWEIAAVVVGAVGLIALLRSRVGKR